MLGAAPVTAGKRAASTELPRPPGRQSPRVQNYQDGHPAGARNPRTGGRLPRGRGSNQRPNFSRIYSAQRQSTDRSSPQYSEPLVRGQGDGRKPLSRLPRDSGYGTMPPSRETTMQQQPGQASISIVDQPSTRPQSNVDRDQKNELARQRKGASAQLPTQSRYPGLILQPDSSPISQDQLAAEVKGIYAGLVVVEAKCINIDTAQAAEPKSVLGAEHWQALIALHRTLLYEHHDFLMATQHPSATSALRGLATKYSMPARMWKHGIHAFLEVLRHRRPDTQDYMLAFIYLAYQMIALLLETVPTYKDTWIECLGDLARYRMAIEEEREAHATWGGVAARWYTLANDRHPAIGRLNHHLGILERPSLRKFFLYAKSLTCVIPFPNARDSLTTLCGPILQDSRVFQDGNHSAEARIVIFHAQLFSESPSITLSDTAKDALSLLRRLTAAKLRDIGVPLVVSNIAALLQLGSPTNRLWQTFGKAVNQAIQSSRPSASAATGNQISATETNDPSMPFATTSPTSLVYDFCYTSFNSIIQRRKDRQSLRDALPSVHAILVWLQSIHSVRSRLNDDECVDTCGSPMNSDKFSWGGLSDYLNTLMKQVPVNSRIMEFARQGMFPEPEGREETMPLPEDFLIRGLIWTQFYFPSGWFSGVQTDDEDARAIETEVVHKARVERVEWLGLYLAFRTKYLQFNVHTQSFWTPVAGPSVSVELAEDDAAGVEPEQSSETPARTSRSPTSLSVHSDSDGYAVVGARKVKLARSWADVASKPTKNTQEYNTVKIGEDDGTQWEP